MGIIRVIGKDLLCIDALQRLSYRRADTERAFSGMKVWAAKKNMYLNCARRLHTSAVRDMISDIAAADRASCTFAEEEAWSRIMDCMGRLRDTRR